MIKKLLTMVLVAGLVFTGNVFASTETTNKLEVKVNRSIGNEVETYRITLNDSLKEMKFRISEENYFNLVRGKNTFNVSGKYDGKILEGSIPTSFKSGLTYGDFELGLVLKNDNTIMITPNEAVIQRIKEEIEKERTTELTFEGGLLDITSYNNVENIIVSENIKDPKIRLPETIKKDLTIVSLKTKIVFPEGVEIAGLEGGVMNLPKEVSVSIPKKTNTTTNVMLAIEVGGDNRVEFNEYVELIFPNMAGKKVGFFDGNDFKEITEVCSASSSSDECKKNEEGDLVVLTKHFTTFAVYTETTSSSGGGESATYLTISNVYVSVNKDEATITFTTNNPALVILKYGNSQVSETQFKTSHSFKLTNLSVQKYNFKIEVRDKDNNLAEYEGSFDVLKEEGSSVGGGAGGPVPSFEGETSTQIKEQKTYNYGGVITTKPLNEMNREELVRLVLILILKSLLAKKGIIL